MAFITLEGIEGSGKSTQARLLAAALGPDVLVTQEPGGTPLGRGIRSLLLDPREEPVDPMAEALLYFADRAQHVAQVIRPALAADRVVICDRYVDSSLAYQGYGRGLSLEALRSLAAVATGGLRPDLTLFLEVPRRDRPHPDRPARGASIAWSRRFASSTSASSRATRLSIAAEPKRFVRVDGTGAAENVLERLRAAVEVIGLRPVRA